LRNRDGFGSFYIDIMTICIILHASLAAQASSHVRNVIVHFSSVNITSSQSFCSGMYYVNSLFADHQSVFLYWRHTKINNRIWKIVGDFGMCIPNWWCISFTWKRYCQKKTRARKL